MNRPGKKLLVQALWDCLGIPFRLVLFDQDWLPYFKWTTLEEERICNVLPNIAGKFLDIGCGTNTLVQRYGDGAGVDVHDWGGGGVIVESSADLPYEDESFDTISFIACLNHIPYRLDALKEARRLMKPDGTLIITMIGPILGGLGHAIWWYSEDKKRGGMIEGEVGGLSTKRILEICKDSGFELQSHTTFVYGMNHLYLFKPI